jgi:hypothetical protein
VVQTTTESQNLEVQKLDAKYVRYAAA